MKKCPKCEAFLFLIAETGNKEIDDNLPIRCSCGYGYTSDPIIPLSKPSASLKKVLENAPSDANSFVVRNIYTLPPDNPND